jgi:GH15 family glucan-1,4-alpha-glucosidase
VIAAATTSLPEVVGGEANWDYRFAWLRDAALVLRALWVGACPDEADRYLRWVAEAVARDDEGSVPVLYAVDGGHTLDERELTGLRGYRGSRPVRVGNDAWRQRQLDVPGHVLAAAWLLRDRLVPDDTAVTAVLRRLADLAARRWHEPDSGIWEGREGERHYVSSKVMCWVALDRAVRFGERLADPGTRAHWAAERDRVRASVERDGWNEAAGVFTGAYASDHLDASALLIPLVGFLPPDDPRVEATVAAVERDLARDGLVRRWSGAEDGAFLPCSYWLAECHALAGRAERATAVFEAATAHANDLGLLAEMADPGTGELLGNFPQALSHAGLVSAAWAIDQACAQGAAHPSRDA